MLLVRKLKLFVGTCCHNNYDDLFDMAGVMRLDLKLVLQDHGEPRSYAVDGRWRSRALFDRLKRERLLVGDTENACA